MAKSSDAKPDLPTPDLKAPSEKADTGPLSKLERLQLGLVRMQADAQTTGQRIVVVLEGRDGSGKDDTIKRMVAHLSNRATRVVALPKPSDRQQTQWWFQRYTAELPSAGELVVFNRSWYNRAGVEVVMGFSKPSQQAEFLRDAPEFERMLVESGIVLLKYWLDISKEEQAERLKSRRTDPLKALKISDMDAVAQSKWDDYTDARDVMLSRTSTELAPWFCVRADHKKQARRAVLSHILQAAAPKSIRKSCEAPDPKVLFPFDPEALKDGRLHR
ncbi:polyphosphate kinase 2 [soil metagenome]